MRGQILIDQGKHNDPRRRLDCGNSLVELPLAAHEGINMLERRHPFVLRRDRAAHGDQGFARRVGNQMQMEVMTRHEFACLAMVFPKFKEMLGSKRDNWRPRPLATILLDKIAKFIHHYRRLNNNTLADVNLGDRTKTCLSKTLDLPIQLG